MYCFYLGTGKGGTSIWGKPFEDEIKPTLKVNLTIFNNNIFLNINKVLSLNFIYFLSFIINKSM